MTNEELAALLTKLDGEATPGPVKVVLIGYQPEPRLVDSTEKLLAIFGNAEDPREVFDEWNGNAELFATYRNHHAQIVAGLAALGEVERLKRAFSFVAKVHETFKTDMEQGYRSRDREYAVDMLGKAIEIAALQPAKETP